MKTIKIKSMRLVNFKGIRDLDIQFSDDLTNITGRNGLGKTTIFDAFCWLLFDKNSDDRKTFSIKTLDENGNVIERIPHEVTAVIVVDGKEMKVFKSLNEKWVKQRGSAVEEFKGHDTVCMWNDVPLKVTDFSKKIEEEICTEQVFKMLTSPSYFTSQKMETQRSILFKMAGDITDEQIIVEYPEFKQLLDDMSGKTMEEFKKEISAKKKKIKADVDSLPARIDERKRDAVEPLVNEYDATHKLDIAQGQLKEIDLQMVDFDKKMQMCEDKVTAHSKAIFDLKCKIDKRKKDIELETNKDYYEQTLKQNNLKAEIGAQESFIAQRKQRKRDLEIYLQGLEKKANELRAKWMEINAQQIEFNESDFVCPTCKRPFDVADIEAKKAEMLSNFNAEKVSRLTENMNQGKANKALIDAKKAEIETIEAEIEQTDKVVNHQKTLIQDVNMPDVQSVLDNDEELIQMSKELDALKEKRIAPVSDPVQVPLLEKKKELQEEVDKYKSICASWESYRANAKRIMELETMLKEQNQALADLEKTEFSIQSFSKLRTDKMEQSVNSMFTNVKFKMFAKQINGGEVETCEAMVNGVPYSDLNNASKINCGLDIINAIIREYDISAPIFVDNAEAVNVLFTVPAQMVRLVVTEDNKLTIE